jgi:chromosome partitioning protein
MIIVIGNEKGGVGKTTLATNLATIAAHEGRDILLVDTDIQGSAQAWSSSRDEADITPRIPTVSKFGKGLVRELQGLHERYELIVVDAGGRDSVELRGALAVADHLFAPVQASQFDLWALERLSEVLLQAQGLNPNLNARVVITRASPNPIVAETEEAREFLAEFEGLILAQTVIRDRIVYRRATRAGLAVTELKPADIKARTEIMELYREILGDEYRIQTQAKTHD